MIAGPPRTRYRATFIVLAAAVAAYALLQSLVIPVLPTIEAGLHTSQNTVTWVLTAYLLSASIFTPIMGRLGDMFGKERLLVLALVALTVGALMAGLANSITIMLGSRGSVAACSRCPSGSSATSSPRRRCPERSG